MAGELKLGLKANFSKSGATFQRFDNSSITVTGTHVVHGVQNIATSDASISLGSIGTLGYVYVKNLDATNYIIFGSDGSLYPLKLNPGESAMYRWNAAAFHAKAHTAACDLEYILIED